MIEHGRGTSGAVETLIDYDVSMDSIRLWVKQRDPMSGRTFYLPPTKLVEVPKGGRVEPFLVNDWGGDGPTMSAYDLMRAMAALAHASGHGMPSSDKELAAVRYHLEDMRKLAKIAK